MFFHSESLNTSTNKVQILQRVCWYIILAKHDNEQSDLLQRIKADTRYAELQPEAQLLKIFTLPELMRWPVVSKEFAPYLTKFDVFDDKEGQSGDPKAYTRWQDLSKRVIVHNVRV